MRLWVGVTHSYIPFKATKFELFRPAFDAHISPYFSAKRVPILVTQVGAVKQFIHSWNISW